MGGHYTKDPKWFSITRMARNSLKIAFVGLRSIGGTAGGVERAVEETAVRLAARGHSVTVFCRRGYADRSVCDFKGVRLVHLPSIPTKHLEAISHTLLSLLSCLFGYDLVHVHAAGPSLLSFLPRIFGTPVVVTVHGLDWKRAKWGPFARAVLRLGAWTAAAWPNHTVVVSKALAADYRARGKMHVTWIPNGVAAPATPPVRLLKNWGLTGQDYLLYLGRLVPEKGAHVLIEAFRRLDTKLHLLVVGAGTHTGGYVERLHELAKGDQRTIFAGEQTGEAKDEILAHAALFVFPSDLEGMPIVLLEAMSHGLPVVCSDIAENREITGEGDDLALHFRAGNVDDLAARLRESFAGPGAMHARGERARRHVLNSFNWDRSTDQLESLYLRLCKATSGGEAA